MQPTDSGHPLAPNQPGAPAADDHAPMGPPSAEVIARGYEADVYDAKSVLSVPALVILFFVLAFGTVSIIFYFIAYPKGDPRAHPAAADRNKAPLNERLDRIHRGSKDVDQPRLEPLRERAGDARGMPRPETAEGNSPELHPEDLIPTPDRFPALYGTGGGKYGLDKTMGLSDAALKDLFPVQKNGTTPENSRHIPTAANAGRGGAESNVIAPGVPKVEEPAPAKEKDKGGKQ